MATAEFLSTTFSVPVTIVPAEVSKATAKRRMHRIRRARKLQGISLRTAARKTGLTVPQLRAQEESTTDLRISDLHKWQKALEVPLAELLVEPGMGLTGEILERTRMIRLMKTAAAIVEAAESSPIQQLSQNLVDQLVEIMPELKHVGAWPSVGQRRGGDELGRAGSQIYSAAALCS